MRTFTALLILAMSAAAAAQAAQADEILFSSSWATSKDILQNISNALRAGKFVQIRNALRNDSAEALWRELVSSPHWVLHQSSVQTHIPETTWELKEGVCDEIKATMALDNRTFQYKHHNIYNSSHHGPAMLSFSGFMSSKYVISLIAGLTGAPNMKHSGNPSWYRPTDHSTVHNDKVRGRRVSYILHLTKDWDPALGGDFVWCNPLYVMPPTFNSLTLFSVSSRTSHFVPPVSHEAEDVCSAPSESDPSPAGDRRRLAVSGFYVATDLKEMQNWNDFAGSLPLADSVDDAAFLVYLSH